MTAGAEILVSLDRGSNGGYGLYWVKNSFTDKKIEKN